MIKHLIFIAVFLLIYSFIYSQEKNINLDDSLLQKGFIQIFKEDMPPDNDSKVKKNYIGVILIDAPLDTVWRIISEWEDMAAGITNLKYYKKLYEEKATLQPKTITKHLFAGKVEFCNFNIDYTLEVFFDQKNYRQYWRMINNEEIIALANQSINATIASKELKNITGLQYLKPYAYGNKTLFFYSPSIELNMKIPVFIEELIVKDTLKGFLKYVKKESEARQKVAMKN